MKVFLEEKEKSNNKATKKQQKSRERYKSMSKNEKKAGLVQKKYSKTCLTINIRPIFTTTCFYIRKTSIRKWTSKTQKP